MSDTSELEAIERELHATRLRLREAEAKLDLIERTGDIGVWSADMTTGEGTWSRTMYRLYYRDPALGPPGFQQYGSFVHPDDHDTLAESMQTMMQQSPGATPPIQFRTHPDIGPIRYLETRATTVQGTARATGAVVDVTAREGARSAAALSTRRLGQILERMPFVIFGIDREHRITFSNQRISTNDVVGMDYRLFTAEGSRADLEAALELAWQTGEIQTIRAEDRRGRWWEARYVGVNDEHGQIEELIGITVDVTEQRELELKVQQAQKVESLGVLAGGIAHDFNNLLVGIIGNADLAMSELGPASKARDKLESVLAASHRAADLCRQMLAYSGRGHFVLEVVDPRAVVRDITPLLQASISKRATIRYEFDDATALIQADLSQIRQIAMNLITNASDALAGGDGVITISTGTAHIDESTLARAVLRSDDATAGRYTFLEVSDTGAGMDPTTLARMFEPFFSSKGAGRGLGLAAVLGIVRGHSGTIDVTTQVGGGTSIRVMFPAATATPRPVPDRVADPPTIGAGSVLVIDDESAVRTLARRTLARVGFDVITAANGAEGVELYAAHRANIVGVLLDLTMPVMGGADTFRRLVALDPDVRVVLSSGYNEHEVADRFAEGGPVDFLQKPYRPRDLQNAFTALLSDP